MTSGSWEIAILIPARNEEVLLARCLNSVLLAVQELPASIRARIVLVSDSSIDRTGEIASSLLPAPHAVITSQAAAVGAARALAASYAIQTASESLHRLWLANTDADCTVPRHWLTDQMALAEQGVEAIAGIVSVDSFSEHGPEVLRRFETSYYIGNDGTHPHIHGANMGIRADRYLSAGGWADLKTAEDHDLWGRLRTKGTRTRSAAHICVETSGRRVGRAPHGFAAALAAHNLATA